MQMFVSDMDGTLLTEDFQISSENRKAIRRLEKAGIEFTVATGRIYLDAGTICGKHGIHPYIISGNGACIHDKNGHLIYGKWLGRKEVKEIADYLEDKKYCYGVGMVHQFAVLSNWEENLEQEANSLSQEKMEFIKKEVKGQHGFKVLPDFKSCLEREELCGSISVVTNEPDRLWELKSALDHREGITMSIAGSHSAEIMKAGASKGAALCYLAQRLNIKAEHIAAIGDGLNDLEMLEYAGLGIAVENAFQEVKEKSDYITLHCKENGVAHVIEKILSNAGGENDASRL